MKEVYREKMQFNFELDILGMNIYNLSKYGDNIIKMTIIII